ncbi:hypothetical protein [Legionella spiritensis]|uniref:hypothetical protein n=1 Tax=Legionella spiritensis TaxID=452 RepID=UPI001559324A|nr:hypothetical protein [Legionella spiritensis]
MQVAADAPVVADALVAADVPVAAATKPLVKAANYSPLSLTRSLSHSNNYIFIHDNEF